VAGIAWAAVLILFFVSSSLLSKLHNPQKETAREHFSKNEQRDMRQVFANGGISTILAITFIFWEEPLLWAGYLGAVAAVNADTWATEIGTLLGGAPRLMTTFRPVEAGRSGGVTVTGTIGALLGSLTIAGVGAVVLQKGASWPALMGIATFAGFAGSFIDSLLGATVQAQYWCEDTARITERHICPDGHPAKLQAGKAWINNEMVNFLASGCGALIGLALVSLL